MMQAATEGAAAAGKPVAGIRIQREAGTSVLTASYLPPDSQVVCRYLSSRKVGGGCWSRPQCFPPLLCLHSTAHTTHSACFNPTRRIPTSPTP